MVPTDDEIIERFRKIGVLGDIKTFEFGPERFFSISEHDFAMIGYVPGRQHPLGELAGWLEDRFGQRVSIGPAITIGSGPVRTLGEGE